MSQSPFPGPIAPENNPPINPQFYQPSKFIISALVEGVTTAVTTLVDHDYVIGQQVRLLIPESYGAIGLSGQQGYVISIPSPNQVVVDINSTNLNAFNPAPAFGPTPPQIIAIGDIQSGAINSQGRINNGTFIPGSFIDVSPA